MSPKRMVSIIVLAVIVGPASFGEEKKAPEKKSGTVTGTLTAKGENYIHVQADGAEQARKYVPHWRGGAPKDGGGLDKKMLQVIKELKVGSRVRIEWEYEERHRVVKVEVLKEARDAEKK